jgi:hypothetical protein
VSEMVGGKWNIVTDGLTHLGEIRAEHADTLGRRFEAGEHVLDPELEE